MNCLMQVYLVTLLAAAVCVYACQIMDKFMRDPVRILLKQQEVPLEGIQQFYIDVDREEHKFATLCDIYEVNGHICTNIQIHTDTYIHTSIFIYIHTIGQELPRV